MARTLITTIIPSITAAGLGAAGTEQSSDVANGNYIVPSLHALLVARNTTGGALNLTIVSPTPDGAGRTIPDVVKSLGASESWCWRVPPSLFSQTDGTIWITAAGTAGQVKFQLFDLA